MDSLRLQFMGTGAAEGVPSPFCRCRVCENARKVGGKEMRLRSAFRVSDELMIDFGPDIVAALNKTATDLYDLKYLLITHTHEDHFDFGNFFLKPMVGRRNDEIVHVYLNGDAYKILDAMDKMGYNGKEHFFAEEFGKCFEFHQLEFFKESRIGDYLVTPVKGEHPAHFETNAAGYLVQLPDGRKLLYALDTGYYSKETWEFLKGKQIDLLAIECTFGSLDRGDTPYSHLDLRSALYMCDTMYKQGTLKDTSKVYLTHINQEQDYTHEELAAVCEEKQKSLPYEIHVAFDGMKMEG